MINLETTSDIELLKELISTLSNNDNKDVIEEIDARLSLIERSQVSVLENLVKVSKDIVEIKKHFGKMEKHCDDIHVHMETKSMIDSISDEKESQKPIRRVRLRSDDDFIPYANSQEDYQKISLKGSDIIHTFLNRGAYRNASLPINIFELLAIIERFRKNGDSLKLKEINSFCKMFKLNKPQISKIYYNLTKGKFDKIISQVDKMIGESLFTIEDGYIYRNGHNTHIDSKLFNELVSIYANDPYPLCSACKIIHENSNIDSFDLFIVLRKSAVVSKILRGES